MGDGPTVMIVDDDESYSALLSEELSDEGYRTVLVGNGAQAIEMLKSVRPDIIVLDLVMPVMSGMDALGPIVSKNREVPVIIHSSYPDFKESLKSWLADAYLVKSADFTEVKAVIRKLLAKKRPGDSKVSR